MAKVCVCAVLSMLVLMIGGTNSKTAAQAGVDTFEMTLRVVDEQGNPLSGINVTPLSPTDEEHSVWHRTCYVDGVSDDDGRVLFSSPDGPPAKLAIRVNDEEWALPLDNKFFKGTKLTRKDTDLGEIKLVKGGHLQCKFGGPNWTGTHVEDIFVRPVDMNEPQCRIFHRVNALGKSMECLAPGKYELCSTYRAYASNREVFTINADKTADVGTIEMTTFLSLNVSYNVPQENLRLLDTSLTCVDGDAPFLVEDHMVNKNGQWVREAMAWGGEAGKGVFEFLYPGTWKARFEYDGEVIEEEVTLPGDEEITATFSNVAQLGLHVTVVDTTGAPVPVGITGARKGDPFYDLFMDNDLPWQSPRQKLPRFSEPSTDENGMWSSPWAVGEMYIAAVVDGWVVAGEAIKIKENEKLELTLVVDLKRPRAVFTRAGQPAVGETVYFVRSDFLASSMREPVELTTDANGEVVAPEPALGVIGFITERELEWVKGKGYARSFTSHALLEMTCSVPSHERVIRRELESDDRCWVKLEISYPDEVEDFYPGARLIPHDPAAWLPPDEFWATLEKDGSVLRADAGWLSPGDYDLFFTPALADSVATSCYHTITVPQTPEVTIEVSVVSVTLTVSVAAPSKMSPGEFRVDVLPDCGVAWGDALTKDCPTDGVVTFENLPSGRYSIHVYAKNPMEVFTAVCTYVMLEADHEIELELPDKVGAIDVSLKMPEQSVTSGVDRSGWVFVCPMDSKGRPLNVPLKHWRFIKTTRGAKRLVGMPTGSMKVHGMGIGMGTVEEKARVKPGKADEITLEIPAARGVQITGLTPVIAMQMVESITFEASATKPLAYEPPMYAPDRPMSPFYKGDLLRVWSVPEKAKQIRIKLRGMEDFVAKVDLKDGEYVDVPFSWPAPK